MTDTTNVVTTTAAPASASTQQTQQTAAPAPVDLSLTQKPGEQVKAPASTTEPAKPAPVATDSPFEKMGDVGLDMAFDFAHKNGYKPTDELIQAAFAGNFDLIEADMAAKGIQGYKEYLALARQGFQGFVDKAAKAQEVREQAALSVFDGDQDKLDSVMTWARSQADDSEKAEINQMFNAGPIQAQAAMLYLKDLHGKATGVVIEPAQAALQTKNQTSQGYALSPIQYQEELDKLLAKVGRHSIDDHPEYANLRKRRMAYKN